MTEEMKDIINSNDKHIVVEAKAGCVPENTEFFDGFKWKPIKEYQEGDYVLQYNPYEFKGELVKPLKFIKQKNTTKWYKIMFQGGLNYICSGNHDVLYYDENYQPKKEKANKIKKGLVLTPTNSYIGRCNFVFRSIRNVEKTILKDTMEYCFTVPSGSLILRQNHTIFTTGNCGKSTTMVDYIKSKPYERILFLVFNKEMQLDFKKRLKGINNMATVSTFHSVAYQWYLKQGYNKKQLRNISIIDIKNILKKTQRLEYSDLSKINFYFNMWLSSGVDDIKKLKPLSKEEYMYLYYVQKLWDFFKDDKKSDFMPHNVYLKLFQLAKVKLDYDVIIADEFNDVCGAMFDIIVNNLDKKVICIGDSYQNINSFNFTVSGLKSLKEDYHFSEYKLTNSFRTSEDVAKLSSRFLTYMYDTDIKFHGLGHTKIGKLNLLNATKDNQIHLLCRTKIGGLKEIVNVLDQDEDKKIYYTGGLDNFGIKEIEKIINFKGTVYLGGEKFHITELMRMLEDGVEDAEILRIVSIYYFFLKNKDIISLIKASEVKNKNDADIILLTSHVSKGATLKNVKLCSDFKSIEKVKEEMHKEQHEYNRGLINSEANLLYVALTRATDVIDIGETLNKDEKRKELDKEILDY